MKQCCQLSALIDIKCHIFMENFDLQLMINVMIERRVRTIDVGR